MKALTAALAIFALAVSTGAATAGGSKERRAQKSTNYELSQRPPEVRGFIFRPGGYSYDYEYDPLLRRNGPYGNYPQLDTRNFWERVQSDPRSTTTSPSAF